ncbi:MAG: hypothetical protein ACOH2E_02570 [Candidatus Paracaedibacter sp.]
MTYPLLIAEPPFQVLPALAEAVGFNEAAVLQVIHYWLIPEGDAHFKDDRYWVENAISRLYQRFFFWDEDTIGYILAQLEQWGILITFQETDEITYHTIDYALLKGKDGAPVKLGPVAPFIEDILPKANKNRRPSFRAEVHGKGANLYVMEAQDLAHFLACELVLEIQESEANREGSREVICHFPKIADAQFRKFVWEDDTLYEILMGGFQMKIMEQLLAFCATRHAANLVIFADDDQASELGIYRDFLSHINPTVVSKGEGSEMTIPADQKTFDVWLEFMEVVTIKFRQTLWRDQKTNPAIQHYLKMQDL